LFEAFNSDLGYPPGAVLTRIRLRKAKRMLCETGQKVYSIAEACGFGTAINFYNHFKRGLGMSPVVFRRSNHL
jgi:AraC family transcriptional regulator, transcriptional activator FtrA